MEIGLLTAFVAGVLSITSPCVLPLLPLYLAHLVGVSGGAELTRQRLLPHAFAFVIGFGTIFVLLGISLGALGGLFLAYRLWLIRFSGVFMLLMGLHLIGLLRLPWRTQRHVTPISATNSGTIWSSFLIGIGFAAGWTPCVGPVLGAILTLAVGAANPVKSGVLLAVYAAGLAIPFLAMCLMLGRYDRRLARISGQLTIGGGIVMTAVGILMLLGMYQYLFARLVGIAPWLPWEPTL